MSDINKTCYFKGKGYTNHEDYSCPLRIGLCGCDDCSVLATAIKAAIKEFIEQRKTEIENHGMKIVDTKAENIAETKIKFLNNSKGGVHVFARAMGFEKNLCDYYTNEDKTWKLFDFLDSISEICDDYNRCYNDKVSKIIMLNVLNTLEGKVEKIQTVVEKDVDINLSDIENFDKAYLPPIGGKTGNEFTHVVLRSKINGIDIRKISYSGQPYIQVAHIANGKEITIPEEINMYICLYALGNLCRYHPDVWYPFIMKDSTGEKLLMEKMLFYSRRMIPNFVLNRITNQDITFVSDKYSPEDRTHLVSNHEVKELIQKEVNHRINELKYSGIIH